MATRIYLNSKGIARIGADKKFNGKSVNSDEGALYIDVAVDIINPGSLFPPVDDYYVDYVTFVEEYLQGRRPDSLYSDGISTGRVVNRVKDGHIVQTVTIKGPTIAAVVVFYENLRNGTQKPLRKWHLQRDGAAADIKV